MYRNLKFILTFIQKSRLEEIFSLSPLYRKALTYLLVKASLLIPLDLLD